MLSSHLCPGFAVRPVNSSSPWFRVPIVSDITIQQICPGAGGCLLETSGRWKPFLTKAEHKEGALVFYMRSGPRVLYRDGLGGLGSLRLPPPG